MYRHNKSLKDQQQARMQLGPSSYPSTFGTEVTFVTEVVLVLAVEVLDALIADLIERSKQTVDPSFLDWVADELTPSVEAAVTHAMRTEKFTANLNFGDPRMTLQAWVKHWVCPKIRSQFDMYAVHCPCTRDAPVVFYKNLS